LKTLPACKGAEKRHSWIIFTFLPNSFNRRQFLTSSMGAKFDPQGRSWPLGVKLSPKGEDTVFAPSLVYPCLPLGMNEGVNNIPREQSSSLGANFTLRVKLMVVKNWPPVELHSCSHRPRNPYLAPNGSWFSILNYAHPAFFSKTVCNRIDVEIKLKCATQVKENIYKQYNMQLTYIYVFLGTEIYENVLADKL
jgi:hypothetical protein